MSIKSKYVFRITGKSSNEFKKKFLPAWSAAATRMSSSSCKNVIVQLDFNHWLAQIGFATTGACR